jgi:hypothetical protein
VSGEAKLDSLLWVVHRGTQSLSRGSDGAGNGSVGRSMVVGAWAAAGTSCAGQTPVILRSSEVESERGRTVEALAGFIGAGSGTSLAWRGAGRAGSGVGRALARSGRVEHVEVCFCPCSNAC